jgi:hypothetical protein
VAAQDHELFGGLIRELEAELARNLAQHAEERSYVTGRDVRVRIEKDEHVVPGQARIESSFAERPVSARLEITAGMEPRTFDFAGEAEVGRGDTCHIVLDESAVSRRHARLHWTYAGYVLEDLGSSNGTFVNGLRVDRILLRGGEIIEVGLVRLRFSYLREQPWN